MLKIILSSFLILFSANVISSETHGHKESPDENHKDHGEHEEDGKDEHKDEHKEEHKDEHGQDGFKLNAASIKTFDIKLINYIPQKTMLSKKAIYKGLNEVNIYRLRQSHYKRVDFKILSETKETVSVSSADLKAGDQIVINGIGFLRMAEIAASGGLSDSHSH